MMQVSNFNIYVPSKYFLTWRLLLDSSLSLKYSVVSGDYCIHVHFTLFLHSKRAMGILRMKISLGSIIESLELVHYTRG